jgi:hypothetical protein
MTDPAAFSSQQRQADIEAIVHVVLAEKLGNVRGKFG